MSVRRILPLLLFALFLTEPNALAQMHGQGYDWGRIAGNTAVSVGLTWASKAALKAVIDEPRPDLSDNKSFPSGHTALAFAGATSLHKAFGKEYPWLSVAGFAVATAVGVERVATRRHHWYDALAGAGLGIGMTELTWWASDRLFGKDRRLAVGCYGTVVEFAYRF